MPKNKTMLETLADLCAIGCSLLNLECPGCSLQRRRMSIALRPVPPCLFPGCRSVIPSLSVQHFAHAKDKKNGKARTWNVLYKGLPEGGYSRYDSAPAEFDQGNTSPFGVRLLDFTLYVSATHSNLVRPVFSMKFTLKVMPSVGREK